MYKLYNVKAWGSVCVHLLLEELEVPYTNIWMTAEQVAAPEFRELSPLGFIPALGLQDGRTLFESAAIVIFLLSAHPGKDLAPPAGSPEYGEFLSWLNFMSTNLYQTINFANSGNAFAMNAEQEAHIVRKANEKVDALWSLLQARLANDGPWLMGEQFSALDPYCFMLTLWAKPSELEFQKRFPGIAAHANAVRARPKLKAALEAHGIMQTGGYSS